MTFEELLEEFLAAEGVDEVSAFEALSPRHAVTVQMLREFGLNKVVEAEKIDELRGMFSQIQGMHSTN